MSDSCDGASFWVFHLCYVKTAISSLCFLTVSLVLDTHPLGIFHKTNVMMQKNWLLSAFEYAK